MTIDQCFRTCCPSVSPSIRLHFSKSSKTKQISSENNIQYWRDCVGLAKWIIDDWIMDHFFFFISQRVKNRIISAFRELRPHIISRIIACENEHSLHPMLMWFFKDFLNSHSLR